VSWKTLCQVLVQRVANEHLTNGAVFFGSPNDLYLFRPRQPTLDYQSMPISRQSAKRQVNPSMRSAATKLGLHADIFQNPAIFITTVRSGISGTVLKNALEEIDNVPVFARALHTDHTGLKNHCSKDVIDSQKSEIILDTIRVLEELRQTWESETLAQTWLKSAVPALGEEKPADLFDSWEGRRWLLSVAKKIELGEFS